MVDYTKRLYPHQFPLVGDLVMGTVTEVCSDCVKVNLTEYNCEGLLSFKELSNKKIRNVKRAVKVGTSECLEVLAVDDDKGFIDLTRKNIHPDDKQEFAEQYTQSKKFHTFFYRWSVKTGSDLVQQILLEHYEPESDDHPYHGIIANQEWLESIPNQYQEQCQENFVNTFVNKPQNYTINFEMMTCAPNGAELLQNAVTAGLKLQTDTIPFTCIYTGKTGKVGNIFQLNSTSADSNAEKHLLSVVEKICTVLKESSTNFVVKTKLEN